MIESKRINNFIKLKLNANNQDKSFYGSKVQNMLAVLGLGWLSSNIETGSLHIHDGETPGGFVLTATGPVFDSYKAMIYESEIGQFAGTKCVITGGGVITKTDLGWLGDLGVVADEDEANTLTQVAPGSRIATLAGDFMVWTV